MVEVEVEAKEEIVAMELVVKDNMDGKIKTSSEQLLVQELSHTVEGIPTGSYEEIVIPVIVESQQVQKAKEVEPLDKNVELPDLNVWY